jgi:hypothetical protein
MTAEAVAQPAPRERADAGFEFLQRERFGHVVIGAEIEAGDALLDAVGRGQDQHRYGRAACTQPAQNLQPVQPRQAEVEDQQIELVRCQCRIGLGAAFDPIDRVARIAQRAQQAVGEHVVVFGDQDAHGVSS